MSLVNQVLKDLQHRRSEPPDTSGLLAAATASSAQRAARWPLLASAAVAVGLAAFAAQHFLLAPAPAAVDAAAVDEARVEAPLVETAPVDSPPVDSSPVDSPPVDSPPAEEPAVGATLAASRPPEETSPTAASPAEELPESPPTATLVHEPAIETARTEPQLTRTLVATTPRQRADAAYADGVRALSESRRGPAESRFREALGHDASHAEARLALANVLAGNGALREAEAQLQQGLRIAPGAAPLAERYARLLFERGDLAGAIGVLVEAAPPVAAAPSYHALLAALQQRAGNHAAAADTYAALVAVNPDEGLWWLGLGISLEAEQRGAAAYDAYSRAARDPRLSARVAAFVRERLAVLAP